MYRVRLVVVLVLFSALGSRNCEVMSEPQEHIDEITIEYMQTERSLWNLLRSSQTSTTLSQIYQRHEKFLGKDFGEFGIFQAMRFRSNPIFSKTLRIVSDNINSINKTATNGYNLLRHNSLEDLSAYSMDVIGHIETSVYRIFELTIDANFWASVKMVCSLDFVPSILLCL